MKRRQRERMEKKRIRILGINCGHRKMKDGSPFNTGFLVNAALEAAYKFGQKISERVNIETEYIDLADKDKKIRPCLHCNRRHEIPDEYSGTERPKAECIIKNDYMKILWGKISESHGFVFGSPVFTGSYTSNFRILFERLQAANWSGAVTFKPSGCVTTAYMPIGGQESCLEHMMACMRFIEMVPVNWLHGAPGVSGPPYGPTPYEDNGTKLGVEKDNYGKWLARIVGRRVAEWAVLLNLGMDVIGEELFKREFIQSYHPPHGKESWWW